MKKLKKLLPAIIAIVLAFTMVFAVACSGGCGNCGGEQTPAGPNDDDDDDTVDTVEGPGLKVSLATDTPDTIELSKTVPTATIDLTKIVVEVVSETGESLETLSASDYTVELYKGSEKLTQASGLGGGVYQIWATTKKPYKLESSWNPSNFVLVYVVNNLVSLAWNSSAEGTLTEQKASSTDSISSTWKFTATYANGETKDVTEKVVLSGVDTKVAGEAKTATATYTEANTKGEKISKTAEVTYTITAKSVSGSQSYSVVYDVEDLDADKANPEWTITWADDIEDTEGKVTVDYSGNTTGKGGSKTSEDGEKQVKGSVEFKDSKQITITVAEGVTVESLVLWISHGTKNDSERVATLSGGTLEQPLTVTPQATAEASPNLYKIEATNIGAGTYKLTASNTMRLYEIDITYTVSEGDQGGETTEPINFRPEVTTYNAGAELASNDVFSATLTDSAEVATYDSQSSSKKTYDATTKTEGSNLPTRLKLGGGVAVSETDSKIKNGIKIVTEQSIKITFYVRSSNGSASRLFQPYTLDGTTLTPAIAGLQNNVNTDNKADDSGLNDLVYVLTFELEAGTYYFGSSADGVGVYGFDVNFN